MTEKVADVLTREAGSFAALWSSPEWKARQEVRKSQLDERALSYLRAKFPDADETVFFTDSTGAKLEHVIEAEIVCTAAKIDYACANCKNGRCLLPEKFMDRSSRPVALIRENRDGVKYLCVLWTGKFFCRNDPFSGEFGRMFKNSGLVETQITQTFENYGGVSPEVITAKTQAVIAARDMSCLILAGKAGTGKTHLAIAIAIDAMRHGRQAIFRLVSELIDELREANKDNSDKYYELMKTYKEVSCLVLDDMGKERTTKAGVDYVYQIVDYRYRHNLQTIMTTNAPNEKTL